MYTCIHVYVCVYIYIYIYIYKATRGLQNPSPKSNKQYKQSRHIISTQKNHRQRDP